MLPRSRASAGRAHRPFDGREAEYAVLHEALARAGEGRRQVVLIAGAAGAGKTALMERFPYFPRAGRGPVR